MADDMDNWQLITRLISDSEEMRMSTRDQIERMGMAAVPILVRVIEADWISDAALSFARGMLAGIRPQSGAGTPDALIEAALGSESNDVCESVSRALVNFGAAATAPRQRRHPT